MKQVSNKNFRFNRYRVAFPPYTQLHVATIDLTNVAGEIIQVGIEAADTIADVKRFIVANPDDFLGTKNRFHWKRIVLLHQSDDYSDGFIQLDDTSMASIMNGKELKIVVRDLRIIDDIRPDMRHLNLAGRDLSFADLIGCKITRANLRGADLGHAKLSD